jgi:plastocyanin
MGLTVAIVATLAFGATTAWAGGGDTVVAMDDFYTALEYQIQEGGQLDFDNNGSSTHTVTADDPGPDGDALFRTGNVSGGSAIKPVDGTQFLAAGEYDFHCSIHPTEMQATLQVNPSGGGPLARPDIDVKVKSKKLAKVVKSGKLKVEVSAAEPTNADGVSLSAKKGRKSITKKTNLDVNAGSSETAKLKLKKSALEKLAELDKAKVKVTAEVDFGSPAKASKKLK